MELVEQMAAIALVFALLGAAVWLLRKNRLGPLVMLAPRRGPRGEARQLEVVERVALGPQHTLALVKVNGALILVGTGPGVCEIRNVEVSS